MADTDLLNTVSNAALFQIVEDGAYKILNSTQRGRGELLLTARLVIRIGDRLFIIEPPFRSDGSSIPRFVRFWIDPWGRRGIPGIVHDWLDQNRALHGLSKREIDLIFLGLLQANGSPDFEAVMMYLGVRTKA